jgi:hypothetical protein
MTPTRAAVILCSPYAGDVEGNVSFAKQAMLDSIKRGEAPLASHLLYTQVLDDRAKDERAAGLAMEQSWLVSAARVVVYYERGISRGMAEAVNAAERMRIPVEYRAILTIYKPIAWLFELQLPSEEGSLTRLSNKYEAAPFGKCGRDFDPTGLVMATPLGRYYGHG